MRIILLRGLARESGHWLDFPQQLARRLAGNCNIELIDFPGCGKYYGVDALTSVSAMTDHARKLSLPLSPGEPLYVVGISMGGMIALDWAQRFPTEVRGIILINSSTGTQPLWWRLRPGAWLPFLLAIILPCRLRESIVLKQVSNRSDGYQIHLQNWLKIQEQHPITRNTILTMLAAAARFRPADVCAVNGLVLASKQDRLVSFKASQTLATNFEFAIEYHSSAGHDLPMDDPDWVCEKIANYVNQ